MLQETRRIYFQRHSCSRRRLKPTPCLTVRGPLTSALVPAERGSESQPCASSHYYNASEDNIMKVAGTLSGCLTQQSVWSLC